MNIRRLHPNLKMSRTLTGRLAASGFPVLGMPLHSDEGRKFRSLFVAPFGCSIYEADYSQIELRIAAHLSSDPLMIRTFKEGKDIHAATGELVFGVAPDKQDASKHRLPSKAANFGFWMGLGEKGLTEQVHKAGNLEWSKTCPGCKHFNAPHEKTCDSLRFFALYRSKYTKAVEYQNARMAHAEKTGMAYGMWGEEWYLPGVWSPHEEVAEATKRQSFALPIQSGNARMIKQAMAKLHPKLLKGVEPILQIHDSLLFVVPTKLVDKWHRIVVDTMVNITTLKVPIKADAKAGPTWLQLEKLA